MRFSVFSIILFQVNGRDSDSYSASGILTWARISWAGIHDLFSNPKRSTVNKFFCRSDSQKESGIENFEFYSIKKNYFRGS